MAANTERSSRVRRAVSKMAALASSVLHLPSCRTAKVLNAAEGSEHFSEIGSSSRCRWMWRGQHHSKRTQYTTKAHVLPGAPESSDVTLLVRARVMDALLAWRGLANSVAPPAAAGGSIRMTSASGESIGYSCRDRRLPQTSPGLCVVQDYPPRRSRELARLPLHVSADGLRSRGR
jgi:hypothetical protein